MQRVTGPTGSYKVANADYMPGSVFYIHLPLRLRLRLQVVAVNVTNPTICAKSFDAPLLASAVVVLIPGD